VIGGNQATYSLSGFIYNATNLHGYLTLAASVKDNKILLMRDGPAFGCPGTSSDICGTARLERNGVAQYPPSGDGTSGAIFRLT